jgi:hypothetical protein
MGSVRLTKRSKYWQIRYVDIEGVRRQVSSGTIDHEKALRKLGEVEAQVRRGCVDYAQWTLSCPLFQYRAHGGAHPGRLFVRVVAHFPASPWSVTASGSASL